MRVSDIIEVFEIKDVTARLYNHNLRRIVDQFNRQDGGLDPWTGFSSKVNAQSANYTVTADDHIVLIDSSGGAVTVTLPTAVDQKGRQYLIKVSAGRNNVTVDGNGSETIDGATTVVLPGFPFSVWVASDGSNWVIL